MNDKSENGLRKVVIAITCLGLTYFGFEYDSVWCLAGAVLVHLWI